MKKPILSILLLASLGVITGCSGVSHQEKPNGNYTVIKIDGCEYIESSAWTNVPIVHKANCKNH